MEISYHEMGEWYSPFFLETEGVKEPEGAGAIPAPATSPDFAPVNVRLSLNTGDKTAVYQAPSVLFALWIFYGSMKLVYGYQVYKTCRRKICDTRSAWCENIPQEGHYYRARSRFNRP